MMTYVDINTNSDDDYHELSPRESLIGVHEMEHERLGAISGFPVAISKQGHPTEVPTMTPARAEPTRKERRSS